jgi:RNA polymerase sigma-70 factor (ECF subfamily)
MFIHTGKKMPSDPNDEIASILSAAKAGQPGATQRLFSLVYDELKKIAKQRISAGNYWASQTTTLVHEAYLRMVKDEAASWANRHHFFWAAARAMRDILVERARHDAAAKRGGGRKRVELDEEMLAEPDPVELIALNDALERLELLHPDAAKIVELKYFAGLTQEQIAELMHVSTSFVSRQWHFAKAWLASELEEN